MNATESEFIVQVSPGQYLVDIDGRQISTTPYLGRANLCAYEFAARWANFLRQRSYRQAQAVNLLGMPVDEDMLRRAIQTARANAAPPLPQSWEDYNKISSAEMKRRLREPEFKAAIDKILASPEPTRTPRQNQKGQT